MDVTAHEAVLVEVDSRRRVALGKFGHHRRYLASVEPDGTITLRPAVVVSALEAAVPERLRERIEANRADPDRLVRR